MKRLYVLLVLAMIIGPIAPVAAQESTSEVLTLTAPDGATVEIDRDDYGVPHISADTEEGVFFGQGFAVAQDRLFQLEQYRRAALGRIAELVPTPEFLEADMRVRTLYYTEDERQAQFDALSADIQTMLEAYVDGINVYLDSIAVNPRDFQPVEFILLGTPEPWTATHSVAVMQFFMRQFGQFGGQELQRLGELQLNGQAWIDENRPLNDPTVPTTIPGAGTATTRTLSAYTPPPVSPEVIRAFTESRRRSEEAYERLRIPKLGSFAMLAFGAKSASGNAMLLGAPQMGQPAEDAVSIVNEVELISPTLHMGGMSVAGIPGVLIGRNEYFAWTLTSGFSDNTDTFRETVQVQNGVPTAYLHNGEFMPFEAREETVFQGSTPHPMTVLRTIHGPVV
ncbi:MAG: penicillin acylase family protein, partial [Rhodothermales bacterium]